MNTHNDPSTWDSLDTREWLLPLGNGGYASGTVSGPSSRSYHGLMVAGLALPWDRVLVLSHIDARLIPASGDSIDLACHHYGDGVIHPRGAAFLSEFDQEEGIRWLWRGKGWSLEKRLRAQGGNRITIDYRLASDFSCVLELRPFVAWRDHHGGDSPPATLVQGTSSTFVVFEDQEHRLHFEHDMEVNAQVLKHENFRYQEEIERGLRGHEDLQSVCCLSQRMGAGASDTTLIVSLSNTETPLATGEVRPGRGPCATAIDKLSRAVLDFLIVNPTTGNPGILAGYPWFNEWGRDTMIALPGVAAAARDDSLAISILESWTSELRNGLLPNRLSEGAEACSYNSADAPLWYLRCVARYWEKETPNETLRDGAIQVLDAYLGGTDYGIGVDPSDGLLSAGNKDTQLTWMDACHEGECFTPRMGKCVELNALLYEGLLFGAEVASDEQSCRFLDAAAAMKTSFRREFLDSTVGLKDCLSDERPTMRPNQLFAISSASGLVEPDDAELVLQLVESSLLTPFGLRTLNPENPAYRGQYRGGPWERDRAYHQGTVWMWLMGSFIDALMRTRGRTPATCRRAENLILSCLVDLNQGCLGQLHEIFEGDAPYRPCGSPAQAWSATELFRVIKDWQLDENHINSMFGQRIDG